MQSNTQIKSLFPMPPFSVTVHTDNEGRFRFVNLRPGNYRLRCHGPNGFVYLGGSGEPDASIPITVALGQTREGFEFVIQDAKKGFWKSVPYARPETHLSVHRTPDGMLWLGTLDYPMKSFDGVEYRSVPSVDYPDETVLSMDWAADGSLWIGGGSGSGISRISAGQREAFSLEGQLPRRSVNDVHADPDGSVWFATESGLFKYDGRQFIRFTVNDGLPRNVIHSIERTSEGALWIGTWDGLVRFDDGSFSEPESFRRFAYRGAVSGLFQASDGALWFCDAYGWDKKYRHQGAYRYDGETLVRLGQQEGLLSDYVFDIAETSDGMLWFATDKGLSRFDGKTILNFTLEDGLSCELIKDIFVDSDDVIWCVGLGISQFDPKSIVGFSKRDGIVNSEHKKQSIGVFGIERRSGNEILLGTATGVFRSDGKKFELIERGLEDIPLPTLGLYVRQVHRATDGTVWFGTKLGIYKYVEGRLEGILPRTYVNSLASDDSGWLWYGHGWYGGGVSRFNPKTGEKATFTTADGLPDNNVWAIEPYSDSEVWIGTEQGLARYREGAIEDLRENVEIVTGAVWQIRRDSDDALRISSRTGLHRLKGADSLSITVTNGLPDPDIRCSVQSRDGIIWMGSFNRGLLGYDGRAVTVIDQRDGVLGSHVVALTLDEDDSLWIGTEDAGLTRYRPNKTAPSVRLMEVNLHDRKFTEFSNLPDTEIGKRVEVRYQEIDLKTHPEKRQFWYQVKGSSGKMLYSAVTKDRLFAWIPRKGGKYTFEVQAIDRDLNYSMPARLSFRATVPWHANAWITVPGGITVVASFIWAFIARALYVGKHREAERLRERARIARNLHDHLGAGLTHLALLADSVGRQVGHAAATQSLASQLTESTYELSRTMAEVTWAIDPTKDSLKSFISFVSNYAQRFLASCDLRLRLSFPAEIPAVRLPAELRHNLFLVTKEALNNAVKHAQASEIRIEMELDDLELNLSIRDDGRGFIENNVAEQSNGLLNMRKRLSDLGGHLQIYSGADQGTRVHARVPLPKN